MNAMQQLIDSLRDLITDHWVKFLTGFGLMIAGWIIGRWRARREWRKKEFLHRLNISLNIIQPGHPLQIRTLLEKSCSEIFLNQMAVDAVTYAARHTTPQNPLLPLPKDDYWHYLNSVLNEVAERFSLGEIQRDIGVPVKTARYLICLTCEAAGGVKVRKIRAMVIQKKVLLHLPTERPPLESPHHATRWETLNILAAEYQKHPHQFLEMEISA